jgi:hypothetical protein
MHSVGRLQSCNIVKKVVHNSCSGKSYSDFSLSFMYHTAMTVPRWPSLAGFPPLQPGFDPGSGHVGFMVEKAALAQVFSEYFGFPCQAFRRLLHISFVSIIQGWYSRQIISWVIVDFVPLHPKQNKITVIVSNGIGSNFPTDIKFLT